MSKTYILQKDLPGVSAGAEITPMSGLAFGYRISQCVHYEWSNDYIIAHPDWFKPKEQTNSTDSFQSEDSFLNYLIQQKESKVKEHDFETASQWRLVERLYRQYLLSNNDKPAGKYISLEEVVNLYLSKQSHTPKPQAENKPLCGVNLDWELKWHPTDIGQVMKAEECRFIGSGKECIEFIEKNKPQPQKEESGCKSDSGHCVNSNVCQEIDKCMYLDREEKSKPTYTKQQVDSMCEDAFNESRKTHPVIGFKHETFQDYKNSKK